MPEKQITIQDLAEMVNRGFLDVHKRLDQTTTKPEVAALHAEVKDFRKDVEERFQTIEDDVRDIKIAMGPLMRTVAALESDVQNLNVRVNRLERKVGFVK